MYEKTTKGRVSGKEAIASEFKGRVVRLPTGTDAKGKTTYGDFIRFNLPKNGGEAYVRIVETPRITVDTKRRSVFVARSVAERTKVSPKPITEKQWMDATPEERDRLIDEYGLTSEGYFLEDKNVGLVLDGDPSARIDSSQAKRIVFGTITLATDSNIASLNQLSVNDDGSVNGLIDSSVGFHEVYHAWKYFMEATGQWTEKEDAALAAKYGKDSSGRHNEEAAANALRGYMNRRVEGRMTAEDEASPFSRIYALAQRLIRRGKEQKVKEQIAANAEEAFLDQIIADNYTGVGDLAEKPKQAEAKPTTPTTANAPQLPGRKESSETETNGTSTETKQAEAGTEPAPTETEPAPTETKPTATPKPAVDATIATSQTWRAVVPKSPYVVSGHWQLFKLTDLIHSRRPEFAAHKEWQNRIGEGNLAIEQLQQIANNFFAPAYGDSSLTDAGSPFVYMAPGEDGKTLPFVISGNGRVMVLLNLLESHQYDKYRNFMYRMAEAKGFEVPKDGNEYVLVRVVDDLGGTTVENIVKGSNGNAKRKESESTVAKQDGEAIIASGIADKYVANVDGTMNMTPGLNDDFIRLFSQTARDGDEIYEQGSRNITEEGRNRIIRALLNISVGQGERGEATFTKLIKLVDTLGIVRQKNAAVSMAPAVASLESNPDFQIGPDVSRAMADFIDFVEKRNAGKIGTFDEYFGQMYLLDAPSEIAKEVLKLFGSKQSAADIAEYVVVYCEAAAQEDPSGGLFGSDGARSRLDIWNDAKKLVEERRSADGGLAKHSIKAENEALGHDKDRIYNLTTIRPLFAHETARHSFKAVDVEVADKDIDAALAKYGEAKDVTQAVYALPDGKLLRGQGDTLDYGYGPFEVFGHDGFTDDILEKIPKRKAKSRKPSDLIESVRRAIAKKGPIRLSSEGSRIGLFKEPTDAQYDKIYDIVYDAYGVAEQHGETTDIKVDLSDTDLNDIFTVAYRHGTSPRRIIEDLRGWYREGVLPIGAKGPAANAAQVEAEARHSISGVDFTAMAKYYQGDIREIARQLKKSNPYALRLAAETMARAVPNGAVLVPVPGHDGVARDTYALANEIASITGSPVVEALRGSPRLSVYEQKQDGYLPSASELGFKPYAALPDGREVIFIDNVVGTGTTAVAAHDALGQGRVLAFAWDNTAPRPIGIVGGLENAYHSITSDVAVEEKTLDEFATRKGITTAKRRAGLKKTVDGFAKFAKEYRSLYRDAVRYGDWKNVLDFAEQHDMPLASNVLKQYFEDPQFDTKELVGLKIEDSSDVAAILMTVRSPFVESFKAIYLDADKKILGAKILTIGQPSQTAIGKGAVTREMPDGTAFVVVSHNHPSGHPNPSKEDINLTQYVQAELDQSGAKLLDHIITDGKRYYSFNEKSEYEIDVKTPKWEMYTAGTDGIPSFSSQEQVENYIAAHLRDDGDSGHIIYINAKNEIVGVKRTSPGEKALGGDEIRNKWLDYAVEGVTKTGAVGVLVDLGPGKISDFDGREITKAISKKFDMFGVRVIDVLAGSDDMTSWISLSGRQFQDKPTMQDFPKYSFAAGEIGSSNMQNALFLSSYLDKARQMLGKRDWAKIPRAERLAIKTATGWEKGADGKWRLEIMDLPKFDMSKLSKPNPDYKGKTLEDARIEPLREDPSEDAELAAKYMPVKLGAIWSKKDQKAIEARNAANRPYSPFTLLEDTEDTERRYQKLIDGNMEEFQRITEAQEEAEKHSFAGMRGANVAGVKDIDDAEALERRGDDRETIYRLTGWYRGADGLWRVELPFHGRFVFEGDFDGGAQKGYRTVGDYFDWPELFQAYPELRDVEVRFEDLPEDVRGDFDPKTKTIRIANSVRRGGSGILARHRVAPVMVHEIQHAIQSIENHARGGDPDDLLTWDRAKVHDEIRRLALARDLATTQAEKDELSDMIAEHEHNLKVDAEDAAMRYYRLAGEVEARNAANRFFESPSWRLAHPPWETEEVEREQQIINFSEDDEVHWDNVEKGPLHSFAARLETVRQEIQAEGGDIYLAYHGTQRGGFKIFDRSKNDLGQPGFYFSKSRDVAVTYSSPEKYDLYDDDGEFDPLSMVEANALYNEYGIYNVALKIMKPLVVECGGKYWRDIDSPFDANGGKMNTREVTLKALESGKYDGVIFKNVIDYGSGYIPMPPRDVYVVREPEQIKVVDDVTYDDEGNIIPDTDRLDWESTDIRHSVASAWGENFPNVTYVTTRKYVKADAELDRLHHEAKAGNLRSALAFVDRLMPDKPNRPNEKERIRKIKQLAADYPDAWIVPVRAIEATGDNMLPFAYANRIWQLTGLQIDNDIKQLAKAGHTGATAEERFFSRVEFDGHVRRGREYILVDDHVTMGGTLAALRKHIVNRGGKVVAATTLTVSKFSDKLSPRDETLQKLIAKFGEDFPTLLKKAGVADGLAELSEYEAAYLLKFSPDRLRDLMARASDDLSRKTANRHGPGYAGILRSRSTGAGRLGEEPRVGWGVHGPSERGADVQVRDVRRTSAGRSETSDVIPGLDDYQDPDTGKIGGTRFAKTPLFRGHISKELNAVIDELVNATATGEEALTILKSAIERVVETPEGKIIISRYREGNSYNGTESERQDPKRKEIWDAIIRELLDAPITAKNNEGLEISKKTGKPKNDETIETSNAAHPELPEISNDENAKYTPTCGRRLDIVIGPPAAGKSSVFVDKLSIFHRSRVLDSDAIKKRLPGFDKGNGASYVHKESSALNKLIIGMLLDRNLGENVVLPIVGANAKKVLDYIEKFRDAGYSIYLHNNYVPILHSFGRSLNRTMSTGRWISPDVFTGCMDAPSAVFEEIKNKADFWDEFDNDGPRYADPLYVRGSYVDPAYGRITKKPESTPKLGKNGVWTNAMLDPQMMLDFANAMDAEENKTTLFAPRLKQQRFDFGSDAEGRSKHAIRSDLRENRDKAATEALTNWITYFRLSHGSVPMTKTIARMGLAMGMSVVDSARILKASETRAEQMRGSLIEKAAQNGDIATTMALLKREDGIDETVGNLLAGGVAKGGELTHRGVGQINTIIGKRVDQMMRDFTAASLADMERDTGLDLAAEILEQNPDAFADEIKGAKGTDPNAPADPNAEQPSDTDAPGGDGGAVDEGQLSDLEQWKREQARKEALKKVEEFIAKAKAKAAENKEKAEERRRRAEENGEGSGSGDGMGGGDPGVEDMDQAVSKALGGTNPKNVKANFKTKEEFAAFMRVWAEYKFDKTHGLSSLGKSERDKLFAEFYRITVRQELQDLADKLLAPKDENGVTISRIAKLGNGARNVVSRQIARMEKGLRPDTIERMSANIFAFINSAAIRVSRTDLVSEFKKELKDKYIKGEKYEDLKLDSDRRVTGWVEEAARYICRVCDLSKRSINGDTTQLAAERKELLDIINRRADVYDESGKEVARAAVEDMETKKAMWKLDLLDKYGAITSLMPGEILDLRKSAFEYLENQAAGLERLWRDTRAYEDGIRKDITAAIVAPNGQRYQEQGWLDGRLFDALNGLIRLRLHHLTRFADEAAQKQAKNAINKILVMLGDGETAYNRMLQDDRQALFEGLARIFNRNGRADNAAIKKYLNRMTEPIPVELAKQISNQGFVGTMTYGQMLQLLVSLEQRSFKEAVEYNGRQGQAELIRTFTTTDKDGKRVNVFTAEDNMFIEWLRAFYASKRDVISPVMLRMVGHEVDSPDPLYCPIKRSMEDRVQALAEAGSTWDPIAAVFTRRIKNNRDFDEQASILGMFFDRSNETAKLVAWAERGTIIRGVFTNVGVQSAIRRAFGPGELRKIMTQLLATFNGGESKKRTPGELAAVDKALNFTTYAYLGFNPLSSLKQTTSFTVWANALPGGFKDLWKYMTHFDAKALKHLKESDEYRVRYGNEVGSGQDMATKGLNENPSMNPVVRMLSGAGMWMLKKADFAPGGWIAQGVYKDMLDKHMQEGMSFDEADRLAITETFNLLEETQQSGRVYNTNMLTLEHGRIGRLLTQFATSPLQQLQYETQAWREWRDMVRYGQGEKKIAAARQKLVRAAVINHLLIPAALNFVTAVYKKIMGDEPPWEQDGYHWTLLTEILMGQFSRVFFIGAFAQTSLNALFSREYPRGSQILPVEGALGMAASLCITAHDVAVLDAEKVRKDVERLLKSTAPTRIPYGIYRRLTGDADVDRKAEKEKTKKRKR